MEFTCEVCEKLFKFKNSLKRHVKNIHKDSQNCKNHYTCMEDSCDDKFRRNSDFVKHLQYKHSLNIELEKKQFSSLQDFLSWKQQVEISERCNYAVVCGSKSLSSGDIVSYYKCSRSGYFKSKATASQNRMLKSQGSCKINGACTSQITVNKHPDDGTISLLRIKTHYRHNTDLKHVRLPRSDREYIAAKLISGVSQKQILNTYRDKIGSELKRADLLTNKDLLNIKRDYNINIQEGVKHREDAVSIEMWVEECKSTDSNPVLFYKRQGDECKHFLNSDFCLIFMNEYQKAMLSTFGKNIIAIDSTHGLNNYDFELTTVMVLDDYGEGFPVAYMFTNRKDTYINFVFFKKISEAVGIIQAKTFMSDVTEVFFNAWVSVMGNVQYKLYCSWHIDRAWQKNLIKIPNVKTRKWVYKTLKTLQQTVDSEECFQQNMNTFIKKLQEDADTQNFAQYFITTYAHNFQQWAYCFRKGCGINTNMVLESMHKTIKYFYLNGKTVKRLDKGLHAVLNYIRDKMAHETNKENQAQSILKSTE